MKKAIVCVALIAVAGIVIAGLAKANGVDFVQIDNTEDAVEE